MLNGTALQGFEHHACNRSERLAGGSVEAVRLHAAAAREVVARKEGGEAGERRFEFHRPMAGELRQAGQRPVKRDPSFNNESHRHGDVGFAHELGGKRRRERDVAQSAQERELVGCGLSVFEENGLQPLAVASRLAGLAKHERHPGKGAPGGVGRCFSFEHREAEVFQSACHLLRGAPCEKPAVFLGMIRREGDDGNAFLAAAICNVAQREKERLVGEVHEKRNRHHGVKASVVALGVGEKAFCGELRAGRRECKAQEFGPAGALSGFGDHGG